jgi:hypothetical protein
MKIGVTGTRSGMNETQFAAMQEYLSQFVPTDTELHHGDCVGVDVEVAILAQSLGMRVVCHPPEKDELRANHNSDEIRKPLGHFARNRNIVDETDQLMVVPYQDNHQPNGGTWYTHDYAKKKGKEPIVFFPKRS